MGQVMDNNAGFRTVLGRNIFYQKYALDGNDSWEALSKRLVEDVCGGAEPLLSKSELSELTRIIADKKFIPGGRYLYYAGRPLHAFNNCFSEDTKLLTENGWVSMGSVAGTEVNLLSPVDGKYKTSRVYSHGMQDLYEYEFAPLRGKSPITYKVKATRNHKWLLIHGATTEHLSIGDVIPANPYGLDRSDEGFAHGFVYGDGTSGGQLRLCADKDVAYLPRLMKVARSVSYPKFANGDPVLYFGKDAKWKTLPVHESPEYKASFIMGWIAADGHNSRLLCSVNKEALEWFRANAAFAGLTITGELRYQDRNIEIGNYSYPQHRIYIQNFCRGEAWAGYKLVNLTHLGKAEVYCPYEPEFNQIVIDHNIRTFNCYLLKGERDTREEWGLLLKRASDCLMNGGGIGVDYSVFRPSGAVLNRTGGTASGPLPLMNSINEVGRNVMQGGSRRSAIYASLNWQHGDAGRFLIAKNWHDMPIGSSGLTVKDAKQQDFNYPATLDMTNISLNYDDAWLNLQERHLHPTFLTNVRQALQTGEPGFSFNFGDKQDETLRNAPVAGNTQVMTREGYKEVNSIVGKLTEVWTGKQWAPTTFKLTKENTPTVTVEYTGGNHLTCDPSHELFVERYVGKGAGRKLVGVDKVRADSLQEGDILHVSLPSSKEEEFCNSSYTLGFMYGDGHFRKTGGGELALFGAKLSCSTWFDMAAFSSVNANRFYVSAEWTSWKDKAAFPTSYNLSFIAGLFDSDGNYYHPQQRVRCSSVHRDFLIGLQRALETYGIQSSVNAGSIGQYKGTPTFTLVISSSSIAQFARLVPCKRLQIDAENYKPYRKAALRVLRVVADKPQNVYCCDVGVEEHSFCANGVIIANCTEVTSADDSDVCNLGSINLANVDTLEEFEKVVELATKFLVCGTLRADLPYDKVYKIREKNRRLGLGLMGMHEWLLKRGYSYEVSPEFHAWLAVYRDVSEATGKKFCDRLGISKPVAYRAIAPTGTIGILAGTTTGIEPVFAVAYKRRYLKGGTRWHYEYAVDATADLIINQYGVEPDKIESAQSLAANPERRIKFQADVQDYVDMAISSTINMPEWGSATNNENKVEDFAATLSRYAARLRGFTCYPDGSRGGQPITQVEYEEAVKHKGVVFEENQEKQCSSGICGI